MKIEMRDLQKALEVLRSLEGFDPAIAPEGQLGRMRAKAYSARIAIEISMSAEVVAIES